MGMTSKYVPFEVGSAGSNTVVLAVTRTGAVAQDVAYLVRFTCCGTVVEMGHRALGLRRRRHYTHCNVCRQRPDDGPIRWIDELPDDRRPKVPSARSILDLYERAERAVRARA